MHKKRQQVASLATIDKPFALSGILLLLFGLVMVTSASVAVAERSTGFAYTYLLRQGIFLSIGFAAAWFTYQVPINIWQRSSAVLLGGSIFLLAVLLIPGVSREVNGSVRWLYLGPFGIQVSEIAKLAMVIFLSGYIVRRHDKLESFVGGFINPMLVVFVMAILLLLEPDFGATVVILGTSLAMLFLAGVQLRHFIMVISLAAVMLAMIAVTSPYRWQRLTAFMNPWADQFDTGYQLTQALIAFGRGEWFGLGLGSGIQKLFYLPEAHTDFLLAVIGEELGFVGLCGVLLLFATLFGRGMQIGRAAHERGQLFAAFVAYGITLWLTFQTIISVGVNTGLLPTKGLTLPLLSYGGSSLVISCVSLALVLRVAKEACS